MNKVKEPKQVTNNHLNISTVNNIENSAKGAESEDDFAGLFDDIDVNSNKLGATVAKRNDKLVKTIIQQVEKSRILNGVEKVQSSDIQIKVLNSIQGKVLDSESYLSIMNKNLEILFDVLN